jgi:GNAT superfamily N-acetyltransferase
MTTTNACGDLLHRTTTDGVHIEMLPPGSPHADWMARLHVEDLPHGLFPRLGARFVRRWHRSHLESPHGVAFVALHDGRPIGFALGTTDRPANVAWLLEHRRRTLVPAALLALTLRPALLSDFLATRAGRYLRRLSHRGAVEATVTRRPVAVLDAIVVAGEWRGRGIGRSLMSAFLGAVTLAGADRVELVTKHGPRGAAGFYDRAGWSRTASHRDRDGDVVHTYAIDPLAALRS